MTGDSCAIDGDIFGYTKPAQFHRHPVLYVPYDDVIGDDGTRKDGYCRMAHRAYFNGNYPSESFYPSQFESAAMLDRNELIVQMGQIATRY